MRCTTVLVVVAALAVAMAASAGSLPEVQSVPTQAVHVTRDEYRLLRAFTATAGQREHAHAGMARLVDAARDVLAAVQVSTQWGDEADDDASWAEHTARRSVVDSAEVGVADLTSEGIDTPADLQPEAATPETATSHAGVDSNGFPLQRAVASASGALHSETAEAAPLTPDGSHVAETPEAPGADKVRARIKAEREQRHMEMNRRRTPRVEEKAEMAPVEAEVPIEELRAEKEARAAEAASIEEEPVVAEGPTARFPRCKPLKDVDHFALDATDAAVESVSPRAEAAARDEEEALAESRAAGLPVAEQKQHTRDEDRHARELRRAAFEEKRAAALLGDRTGSLDHAEVGPEADVVVGPDGRRGRRVCHIEWEGGESAEAEGESAEAEGERVEAESAEAESAEGESVEAESAEAESAEAEGESAEAEGESVEAEAESVEVEAEAEAEAAPHHHKKHHRHHKKHHHKKKHHVAHYDADEDDEDVVEHRRHSRRSHHRRRHKHGSARSHAEYAEEMAPPFSLNDLGLPTGHRQESIPGFNAPLQNMPGVEMPPQQMMMQRPQPVRQNTVMLQEAATGAMGGGAMGGGAMGGGAMGGGAMGGGAMGGGAMGGGMAGANEGGIPGMMNMFPGGQNQMGVDLGMASPSRDMGLEMEDTEGVPQQVLPGIGAMP